MSPSNLFLFPVYVCRYSECTIYIPGAAETFYHLCPQHITIGLSLRCCTECTLHSHEEGDHHSNAARFGQRPCQGSEGGSFSERGRVGDGGRREQGHAAADRRRRGRGQADEEAEEGGRGGRHPGAADSAGHGQYQQRAGTGQQYRRHAVRVPAARRHSRPERARRQPHRVPVRRRPAAQWPGEHGRQQAVGYYHRRTPGPGYYHQQSSPMVGQGGYGYGYAGGSSFALEVARSHPANYSPMIARHDRPGNAGGRRELGGGGGPNCCSIL